jgi:addiction module HigA family antidote
MMERRERTPIHPGEVLAEDVLAERNMSGRQLAEVLNVSPNRISGILRGRRAITADTALRLSRWLGTTPEFWLDLQQACDLETAVRESGQRIEQETQPRQAA